MRFMPGGYLFDAKCNSNLKTFQAVYNLYLLNGLIHKGKGKTDSKRVPVIP